MTTRRRTKNSRRNLPRRSDGASSASLRRSSGAIRKRGPRSLASRTHHRDSPPRAVLPLLRAGWGIMVIGAGVGAVVVVVAATVTATGMAGARTADSHSRVVKQESCMTPERVATMSSGGATHPLIRGVDRELPKMIPSQFVHRGVQTAVGEESALPGAEEQKQADKILAMQKNLSLFV